MQNRYKLCEIQFTFDTFLLCKQTEIGLTFQALGREEGVSLKKKRMFTKRINYFFSTQNSIDKLLQTY